MIRVMPCTQPDSAATSRSPCQSVGAPRGSVSETCSGAPPVCEPALGSGSPAAGRVEGAKYIVGHPSQYQLVNHTQWQTRCEWGCHSCDSHPDIARGAPFTAHGCTAIARYTHVCCARAARAHALPPDLRPPPLTTSATSAGVARAPALSRYTAAKLRDMGPAVGDVYTPASSASGRRSVGRGWMRCGRAGQGSGGGWGCQREGSLVERFACDQEILK